MRRQHTWFAVIALAVLLASRQATLGAVFAQPLQQQSQVQISAPEMNAEVRGMVAIVGSASVPDFQFYKVEFGVGPNPAQWAIVGSLHDRPAINTQLELWDTTKLPDGVYSLRLQAVKRDGNYIEFFVRGVGIANAKPTATVAPSATPILRVTPTAAIPSTPQLRPTATLQIIAPTVALVQATVTPTLSRPQQRTALPIDPKTWGQSFVMGAAAMGAVMVLLGLVFGLRRLL